MRLFTLGLALCLFATLPACGPSGTQSELPKPPEPAAQETDTQEQSSLAAETDRIEGAIATLDSPPEELPSEDTGEDVADRLEPEDFRENADEKETPPEIEERESLADLIKALEQRDRKELCRAARLVGKRGSEAAEAAPALASLLLGDEEVAREAATALRKIGRHAAPVLLDAYHRYKSPCDTREACIIGLAIVGGGRELAPELFVACREQYSDSSEVDAARVGLAILARSDLEVQAFLGEMLDSEHIGDRCAAGRIAWWVIWLPPFPVALMNESGSREELNAGATELAVRALADPEASVRICTLWSPSMPYSPASLPAEIVSHLVKMLDEDDLLKALAAQWLATVPHEALPQVKRILRDENPETRIGALQSLRAIVDFVELREKQKEPMEPAPDFGVDMVPLLMSMLDDEDEDVRNEAASTLGAISGLLPETVPTLIAVLKQHEAGEEESQLIRAAAIALTRINSNATQALSALVELLQAESEACLPIVHQARIETLMPAIRKLAPHAPDVSVPLLISLLQHRSPSVVHQALDTLGHIGPPASQAVPELIAILKRDPATPEDQTTCRLAAKTLGQIGAEPGQAIPAMVEVLEMMPVGASGSEPAYGPVLEAIRQLASRVPEPSISQIARLTAHGDPFVARKAVGILGHIAEKHAGAIQPLVDALQSDDALVGREATLHLLRIGPEAASRLIEAARQPNLTHYVALGQTLGVIARDNPGRVSKIIDLLDCPGVPARKCALIALVDLHKPELTLHEDREALFLHPLLSSPAFPTTATPQQLEQSSKTSKPERAMSPEEYVSALEPRIYHALTHEDPDLRIAMVEALPNLNLPFEFLEQVYLRGNEPGRAGILKAIIRRGEAGEASVQETQLLFDALRGKNGLATAEKVQNLRLEAMAAQPGWNLPSDITEEAYRRGDEATRVRILEKIEHCKQSTGISLPEVRLVLAALNDDSVLIRTVASEAMPAEFKRAIRSLYRVDRAPLNIDPDRIIEKVKAVHPELSDNSTYR